MMKWFGVKHGAPIYAECPQVDTPAVDCAHCEEPIVVGDDGFIDAGGTPFHRECWMRMILGSVAHQAGVCACHGEPMIDAEATMSRRQAAKAAMEYACTVRTKTS